MNTPSERKQPSVSASTPQGRPQHSLSSKVMPQAVPTLHEDTIPGSEKAIEDIAAFLKTRSGFVLGAGKDYLLRARLGPVMRRAGLATLDQLAQSVQDPRQSQLAADVVAAMAIHETSFFRDARFFTHFAETTLPHVATRSGGGRRLRIWSAATAMGQEAYSIAMIAAEKSALLPRAGVEIVATDLSASALARAQAGVYSQFEIQRGLPVHRLLKHFRQVDQSWHVAEPLRQMISFRVWNLLHDPVPLGQFDVIFCRNVLIYFDHPTRERILEALARRLHPGGRLYLGSAEHLVGLSEHWQPVPEPGEAGPTGGAMCYTRV